MRSLLLTIFLFAAVFICGLLVWWQVHEGNLDRLFGSPPLDIGTRLYSDLDATAVQKIRIKQGDDKAEFILKDGRWWGVEPWKDRMDARAAIAILTFANTATVEDVVPRDDLASEIAGLDDSSTEIALVDRDGETLAFFRLGRVTPWKKLTEVASPTNDPLGGQTMIALPTTYVLPLERGRKSYVYAASGNILTLFKQKFANLRDHRPFFFNPLALEQIRIQTSEGELTLGRTDPKSAWRIVKPLDLATDASAVKNLLEGLVTLQAAAVRDQEEVTLLTPTAIEESKQISIRAFGEAEETTLQFSPLDDADSNATTAVVSDRPNAVFVMPSQTTPEITAITDLPLTVNELRDSTLTNLNIASIRGIAIETATSTSILISREPPKPWVTTIRGVTAKANETQLFALLKAVTDTRVLSFETDAAPADLTPWGLDRPILKLTFLAANHQTLRLHFGLDARGRLFAKRETGDTVMRLDPAFLEKIAVRPYQWRHSELWVIREADLLSITITEAGGPPMKLKYSFFDESWTAEEEGKEVTADLDPVRASYLLKTLENLQVEEWLSPKDELAAKLLESPVLSFVLVEKTVDEFGDDLGKERKQLDLAIDSDTQKVYGRYVGEPSLFTISVDDALKLSLPLLDK